MKKIYLFLILLISTNIYSLLNAQTVTQAWATSYGTAGTDLFTGVTTDGSGNIFLTGTENVSTNSARATIVKYNSAGAMQWLVRYNGPSTFTDLGASFTDGSGNTFIAARVRNTSHTFLAVVKYNSSAQQQWVSLFDSAANLLIDPKAIKIDGAGNVYVAGTINSELTDYNLLVVKFNASGVRQWAATYNGSANGSDFLNAMTVDAAGNVYIAGQVFNSLTTRLGTTNSYDYVTLKYSTSGVLQWRATYSYLKTGYDAPKGIATDASGNVYVTGYSAGSGTGYDYATVKYNAAGALQWSARFASAYGLDDIAVGLAVDGSGNVYVTGTVAHNSTSTFMATVKYNSAGAQQWFAYNYASFTSKATAIGLDNSGNIYVTGTVASQAANSDAVTIKYTTAGAQSWLKTYNNLTNGSDEAQGIRIFASGVTGINPPVVYIGGKTNTGTGSDLLLIKYTQSTGNATGSALELAPTATPEKFGVSTSPNPSKGPVTIRYSLPEDAQVTLRIYNVSGEQVATLFSGARAAGQYQTVFNSSAGGKLYYCTLVAKSSTSDYKETKAIFLK